MLSLSCEACLIKQGQASLKTVELQEDHSTASIPQNSTETI